MPMKSQAQRKAMHVAVKGKSTAGIPRKVAREFVKEDRGGKLLARVTKKRGK